MIWYIIPEDSKKEAAAECRSLFLQLYKTKRTKQPDILSADQIPL